MSLEVRMVMETPKGIKYNSKCLYINQFPLEYSAKHNSLKSIIVTCKQTINWRRELIYSKFLSFILMNHKLSFHQEMARGKRFDENSVNTPGGIIVEIERAYETLLFYSVSHCWAGLFMNFMSRNLTQLEAARLKNISNRSVEHQKGVHVI